jgi:hypothetical protein
MIVFMMRIQQDDRTSEHSTESEIELEPESRTLIEPTDLSKTLIKFYDKPTYEPAFTYRCDPSGRSCICLQDWYNGPVCADLDREFDSTVRAGPQRLSRPPIRAMIEPQWEYLNRYEPGMYDCPGSICSVELANTDKFRDCIFVPLERRSVLNFSTVQRSDCSFPVLHIKLPTCVEVKEPRPFLASYGVKAGMMVTMMHGIPINTFKDLEQAERSLAAAPRPSNVLFCYRSTEPADERENAKDVFIFSGDKVGKGWEMQRPFAANPPGFVAPGLRAAVVLENFERWYPTYQGYLDRLGELYLNETDLVVGYKPVVNPRRHHHWVPLYYPDVPLESFRMPTVPAADRIHAVAWFSSECSPDYAPER